MKVDRLAAIKAAAQRVEAKQRGITFEEVEMQDIIKTLDARKVKVKAAAKIAAKVAKKKLKNDLTTQVKKAARQSPGSLEFNSPENMFYSDRDTKDFIENSSYFENYQATRDKDWD
jgi:hypothetical protein